MRKQSIAASKLKKVKVDDGEEDIEPASFLRILKYGAPEWLYMLSGVFFAAITGTFPLLFALIISSFLDEFTRNDFREKSNIFAWLFFGLGLVLCVSYITSALLFGKAGEVLTRRLRKLTFKAILRQEIAYFDDPKNSTGQISSRLASDASNIQSATGAQLNTMAQIAVISLAALVIGFYTSWKLTLLILAFTPVLFIAGVAQFKVFGNFAAAESRRLCDANASASESIMNIRTIASLGKEEYFADKFNAFIKEAFKRSAQNSAMFGLTFGSSESIWMLANAATYTLAATMVQEGEIKFKEVITVYMATQFGSIAAGQAFSVAPDFAQAKICAARIFQILDRIPSIDLFSTEGNVMDVTKVQGNVSLNNIDFHYPTRPGVKVMNDLTLDIKAGQKVALVGSSGCGKSTIVGLLERFYDPISGLITIDNYNSKEINIRWLRSIIGLVSQEPVLFARSIRNNITFGLQEKPSEEVIETAAKNANIHSFISSLPKGYDTMVGEKGTLISGGQKQRIAIARALIRNPKIMLLDEATSALDSESERVVQDALDAAMMGRTSIIIAHRLSTIQNADVIVVIQKGKIAEIGTHQELLDRRGVYYKLNRKQVTA